MVLSKQAVTKCRKNQVFIFLQSKQKMQHPVLSTNVKKNNHSIERVNTMKFLGVLLDDNFSWKEHIKYLENKIAKNTGLMYRVKPFLDKESFLALFCSSIHSYLNYANLAWSSTYLKNLKKLRSQQKHAILIVHNKANLNVQKNFLNQQMF